MGTTKSRGLKHEDFNEYCTIISLSLISCNPFINLTCTKYIITVDVESY